MKINSITDGGLAVNKATIPNAKIQYNTLGAYRYRYRRPEHKDNYKNI